MSNLKFLVWGTYYNLLINLRIKQAVFFAVFFPLLLFLVFGLLWGGSDPDYNYILLTGVICMTIATDGFFVIGVVLKDYYQSGFIKYVNKLPLSILNYIFALILSRLLIIFAEILLLVALAQIVFGLSIFEYDLTALVLGCGLGLVIYAFIGLCVHFVDLRKGGEKNLANILYFILLFTSDCFYPASGLNETLGKISNLLPFNAVLGIMRPDLTIEVVLNWVVVAFWTLAPLLTFMYIFNRYQLKR